MINKSTAKVRAQFHLTPESHWRINMHALVEEKTTSEIIVDLIEKHLPNYEVSIENPEKQGGNP